MKKGFILCIGTIAFLLVRSHTTAVAYQGKSQKPPSPIILPSREEEYRVVSCKSSAIKKVQPVYPPEAQKNEVKGTVVVKIFVDKKGKVESAMALSGPPILRQAALEAARQWRFPITRVRGKAMPVTCSLAFSFPPLESQKKKAWKP